MIILILRLTYVIYKAKKSDLYIYHTYYQGGAIYLEDIKNVSIVNNSFTNCSAGMMGGELFLLKKVFFI